jgi:cytoskeleton protein RodZ
MSDRQRKVEPVLSASAESGLYGGATAQTAQAGAMLRQLRESAGVDSMLLASALKVSPQKIQALEEGYLNGLPGLAFARSLATAVCRHFAADPAPVLALMPQAIPDFPVENGASRELFKPSTFGAGGRDWGRPYRRAGMPGWVPAVVAVLLIGALAVWLIPGRHLNVSVPQATSSAADAAKPVASAAHTMEDEASAPSVQPASELEAAPISHVPSQSAPVASVTALPHASAERRTTVPAVPSAASEPAASAVVSSAIAASTSTADQGGGDSVEQNVITFTATGRVWVGVYDGSGEPLLNHILTGGDTVSVGGELPLTVTVGNMNAVTVTVRGQPLDLSKHTHGGRVARFTVDPAANP